MRLDLPRVLIVEDDPSMCRSLSKFFETWGWSPVRSLTVADALLRLSEPFTLVHLDLVLPDGSGVEVLREIRARKLPVTVVVSSGMDESEALELVAEYSPDQILHKPIDLDALQDFARVLFVLFHGPVPVPGRTLP